MFIGGLSWQTSPGKRFHFFYCSPSPFFFHSTNYTQPYQFYANYCRFQLKMKSNWLHVVQIHCKNLPPTHFIRKYWHTRKLFRKCFECCKECNVSGYRLYFSLFFWKLCHWSFHLNEFYCTSKHHVCIFS